MAIDQSTSGDYAAPLRVMFLLTSAHVGGSEVLTQSLIRRLDRRRFEPELCCLKELGPLGETLVDEICTHHGLLQNKYDVRVLPRLTKLLRWRRPDALISVGAGDKLFWGRLAARLAGVPVVVAAIHSTGWPDPLGWLNRRLTPLTDRFVGVSAVHGRYLLQTERLPPEKVCVIPNGVDTDRFRPQAANAELRRALGIGPGPLVGTIGRLMPEKNHALFLEVAARMHRVLPDAQFLIVGDGPLLRPLQDQAAALGIADAVHFPGLRSDVPDLLGLLDLFLLTSHTEANPVSVLEALSSGLPVVATRVGGLTDTVPPGVGYLVEPGDAAAMAEHATRLLQQPVAARAMGQAGRETVIRRWSLTHMVEGYQDLLATLYGEKCPHGRPERA